MTLEVLKRIKDIKDTNTVFTIVGLLGFVGSVLIATIEPDLNTALAIIVAIFSGVALIIVAIQKLERTLIENTTK
jgi:hypothetical protein